MGVSRLLCQLSHFDLPSLLPILIFSLSGLSQIKATRDKARYWLNSVQNKATRDKARYWLNSVQNKVIVNKARYWLNSVQNKATRDKVSYWLNSVQNKATRDKARYWLNCVQNKATRDKIRYWLNSAIFIVRPFSSSSIIYSPAAGRQVLTVRLTHAWPFLACFARQCLLQYLKNIYLPRKLAVAGSAPVDDPALGAVQLYRRLSAH